MTRIVIDNFIHRAGDEVEAMTAGGLKRVSDAKGWDVEWRENGYAMTRRGMNESTARALFSRLKSDPDCDSITLFDPDENEVATADRAQLLAAIRRKNGR